MRIGHSMTRRILAILLAAAIGARPVAAAVPDDALQRGARQVERGAFDAATATLEGVVLDLERDRRPEDDPRLAEALLYLGAAQAGLGDDASARVRFRRALALAPGLTVGSRKLPERAVSLFAEVKAEQAARGPAGESPRKGGSGGGGALAAVLVIGGAAGAAVVVKKNQDDARKKDDGTAEAPPAAPAPKAEVYRGTLVVGQQPTASVSAGPGAAGAWSADLVWTPTGVVLDVLAFSPSGALIARGRSSGPTSARVEWTGAADAVYRLDVVLSQPGNAKSADWEVTVKYPPSGGMGK
jgi:hypothetical protein